MTEQVDDYDERESMDDALSTWRSKMNEKFEQAKQEKDQSREAALAKWIERHTIGGVIPHHGAIMCWKEGYDAAAASQWTRIETVDDLPKELGRYLFALFDGVVVVRQFDPEFSPRDALTEYAAWMPIPTYQPKEQGEPSSLDDEFSCQYCKFTTGIELVMFKHEQKAHGLHSKTHEPI